MLWGGIAAVLLAAAAVSATQALDEEERIGVCHATPAAEEPYVFLVVKKDGYEHGHHRHHDGDFFVDDLSRGCQGDDPVVPGNATGPAGNESPSEPVGNETPAEPVPDEPAAEEPAANETPGEPAGNETPTEPAGNETPEEPAGNETPEEPAGNETPEEPADNETPAEPSGNETPAEPSGNETPAEPAGDAAIRQTAAQDDFAVTLTLRVTSLGPIDATDVTLDDQLPDLRRSWQLTSMAGGQCVLDGRSLTCWFGDLAPGEERVIELRGYTDRMPCGFALTNTAFVSSTGDAEERNDASSASIAARAC